jgi:hypothetical protein
MPNHVLLEKITIGAAGATSIKFNSIPQTGYNDLKIVYSARTDEATTAAIGYIKFNGSTSNFTQIGLQGTASAASSFAIARFAAYATGTSNTSNAFSNGEINIPSYNSAIAHPFSGDVVVENRAATAYSDMLINLWAPGTPQAITSIELATTSSNWTQYSTFSLYGISNSVTTPVIAPLASGGEIIQNDGTYWYHAFLNGTQYFTPTRGMSCDVLVVAGGAGGGGGNAAGPSGGGGGAGGVLAVTGQRFLGGNSYPVTVGSGGTGGTGANGTNGQDSSIGTSIAIGGGYGSGGNTGGTGAVGGDGGSGGGASQWNYTGTRAGGTATSGQGNNGGSITGTGSGRFGGGGGGAGGAGGNTSSTIGAGGAGTNSYSSWLSTVGAGGVSGYIAGGGGSAGDLAAPYYSAGGSGGGGVGGWSGNGGTAIANTGSGGGGSTYSGGSGGSGIVIVRYLM